jgi:hypothetical protein
MRTRRPEAITAMAVINIIFGSLSILCGGCGAAGLLFVMQLAHVPGPNGGPNPVAQLFDQLNKECPGYQVVEVGRSVGVLVLGVVLIAAAIGLLQMQSWGRWVTVAYAALAIPLHVGYLGYEMGVVLPATQRATAAMQMQMAPGAFGAQQNPGQQAGTAVGVVSAAGISVLHAAANLVVMLLPGVGAAFAGRPRRRRRRDYDEDEEGEDEEDEPPRRPRRRARDDDDEGIRPSRRE